MESLAESSSSTPVDAPQPEAGPSTAPRAQAATSAAAQEERNALHASHEEVWYLKEIAFTSGEHAQPKRYKVITQNYNGPCSFIAICNILILRDDIHILPENRRSVSYEFLAQLLAEYLLLNSPDVDISAALSMMPLTTKGMDLNPLFTGPTSFRPATTGGELELFASAGIPLVHGWLVDPASPEHAAVSRVADYDAAVNLIVEADVLTRGRLVGADGAAAPGSSGQPSSPLMNEGDQGKVEDAMAVRSFLDSTRSQLTYHGLFTLASLSLPPPPSSRTTDAPTLLALFRNSHLAVLYKHPSGVLYTLASDQVFLNEPSVVWERLEDVDQGGASFVDSAFRLSAPAGGDWAGWVPPPDVTPEELSDQALARQLQQQEDAYAQHAHAQRQEAQRQHELYQQEENRIREQRLRELSSAEKRRKKECIIM
ncbi:DUF544-domain-containing protein [Auriscalpium vulgare]|uniref:DUF544-domain-containing protein n=1 Tax=Auriscalpium vulgare TaxID=40419 RepID=A0ACB8S257_9AGAM|nr:DUF544-domain-containing protein [Auriscalpium vulgare]